MGVQGELFGVDDDPIESADAPPAVPEALAAAGQVDGEQLALLQADPGRPGRGRGGAVPSEVWRQLLDHPGTRARYAAKVHRRGPADCWFWVGAISDTGHGKLKATRTSGGHVVVTAHVYGWQLAHGPIRPRPGEDLVVAHTCDESACQNPAHWELVARAVNGADYRARRWRAQGPLADVRGPHGRAVALRAAILSAVAEGRDVERAIARAAVAGLADSAPLF